MATFPLSDLLSGVKSIGVRVKGKKSDNSLEDIKTNDAGALKVYANGNSMELFGSVIGDRPAANTVAKGTTFTIVDANLDQNWISDGTNWLEV